MKNKYIVLVTHYENDFRETQKWWHIILAKNPDEVVDIIESNGDNYYPGFWYMEQCLIVSAGDVVDGKQIFLNRQEVKKEDAERAEYERLKKKFER